jgi:MinD-like ATPase involved in chromosome partitioning or flagellar assembly
VTPNLAAVNALGATFDILSALGRRVDEQRVILNQAVPRPALTPKQVETALGDRAPSAALPYAESVENQINVGQPAVLADPEGPLGAALIELAHTLSQPVVPPGWHPSALLARARHRRG